MTEWKKGYRCNVIPFLRRANDFGRNRYDFGLAERRSGKNQKVLDKAYNLYVLGIMCAPNPEAGINNSRSFLRFGWPKVLRYAGVAAAILLLGIAVDHVLLSQRMNRWLQQQTTVEVPAGQHIRLTLGDGSIVELNAQSRIVYPAIFPKGERRVQLSGEAIFNVAHNSECPFIVETFACDVEVLGTHFDVIANQAENRFQQLCLAAGLP